MDQQSRQILGGVLLWICLMSALAMNKYDDYNGYVAQHDWLGIGLGILLFLVFVCGLGLLFSPMTKKESKERYDNIQRIGKLRSEMRNNIN